MLRHLRAFAPAVRRGSHATPACDDRAARLVLAFEEQDRGWFWEIDDEGRLTYLSPSMADLLRCQGIEAMGKLLSDLFEVDENAATVSRTLPFHLANRSRFDDCPVRCVSDNVGSCWSISGTARTDEKGRHIGFVGSGGDLTERRRSQAAITRLAFNDSLTGLANRERMKISLEQMLASRSSGFNPTALLLLDLDRFKIVNDTLGHQTGDELLKLVAQRLGRVVGTRGLVGRIGGDEFQVVVAHDHVRDQAGPLSSDIIAALSQPYSINGSPISIGCSIGVAIAPDHGCDASALVRSADLALYAAKDGGRGIHREYSDDLLANARKRKGLEDDLRNAVANGELRLMYQPVVATSDARIVGFEALLRWQHPVKGPIGPAEFIPIAEESGLIIPIGEWVLRKAAADAAAWPADIRIAVNVSPIQFADSRLGALVANVLSTSGLQADRLELEITESVFLDDSSSSERTFNTLKKLGIRLALDDFGTGYSSLGYLQSAPFNKIKIDQGFVRGAIMSGNRNAAIIQAIVTLAEALGMETTAEGVEQQDEIAFIKKLGCSHIQGYVYGRPMPLDDVISRLKMHGSHAVPIGHKISRGPRIKTIKSATVVVGRQETEVCIRNVSRNGAMIEGAPNLEQSIGLDIVLRTPDNSDVVARVRWVSDGEAGLSFAHELLNI